MSPSKPWADTPCALITTPQYVTKKTDIFTIGATHMAHIHNAILRGYNTIYHQAPHIQDSNKAAFVGYVLTWYRSVKRQDDDEETELFSAVERLLSSTSIWKDTYSEHEAFLPGLSAYEKYLTTLPTPTSFNGTHLQTIMFTFQTPFITHFHSEIRTIASLAEHPSAPAPHTAAAERAAATFKAWGKKTVTKAGSFDVAPFFLLNLDAGFEEGLRKDWPPMPRLVRWGLVNVGGSVHWAWWKFASCDAGGERRELFALG